VPTTDGPRAWRDSGGDLWVEAAPGEVILIDAVMTARIVDKIGTVPYAAAVQHTGVLRLLVPEQRD
jgi:hypothetical protein